MLAAEQAGGRLISFLGDLAYTGSLTIGQVLVGELEQMLEPMAASEVERLNMLGRLRVQAFTECTVAPSLCLGVQNLLMTTGIASIRPNTIVFGTHGRTSIDGADAPDDDYCRMVQVARLLRKHVVIARGFDSHSRGAIASMLEANQRGTGVRLDLSGHGPRAGGRVAVWLPPQVADAEADDMKRELFTLQLAQVLHAEPFWMASTRCR